MSMTVRHPRIDQLSQFGRAVFACRLALNNGYWKVREVPNAFRFQGWNDPDGKKSWDQKLK
jgi:hypothetical protein